MTDAQRARLYFPAWSRAFKASWEKDLTKAILLNPSGQRNDWALQVDQLARDLCARHFRAPGADDLRKACHIVAIGRACSSKALTNRHLDRVLVLFSLLADPDNVSAVIAWSQADKPDEKRLRWCVEHCGFEAAYIACVCRDKFGTHRWESLDLHKLHQLVVTLEERRRSRVREVARQPMSPDPALVTDPEGDPVEDTF